MHPRWIASMCLGAMLLLLAGCNLPTGSSQEETDKKVQIAAAQTVVAIGLTQTAIHPSPSPSITPSAAQTQAPTAAAPASATPVPPSATVALPCNAATFITDVTIPDGTKLAPGATFTKTWQLKNNGTCAWTTSYKLVFSSGPQMGGASPTALTANVNPGETYNVSVNLTAPNDPGKYKGYWMLQDASGHSFGLNGGEAFWVDIEVVGNTATITSTPTITPTASNTPGLVITLKIPVLTLVIKTP